MYGMCCFSPASIQLLDYDLLDVLRFLMIILP